MKRSDRMGKILKVNKQQEHIAAASFVSANEQYQAIESQLARLEEYRAQYSAQLEELKQTTSSATELREFQNFLAKISEAIEQQKEDLIKSAELVENTQDELRNRRIDVEKIKKASDLAIEQEQADERKRLHKEYDELYANNKQDRMQT